MMETSLGVARGRDRGKCSRTVQSVQDGALEDDALLHCIDAREGLNSTRVEFWDQEEIRTPGNLESTFVDVTEKHQFSLMRRRINIL